MMTGLSRFLEIEILGLVIVFVDLKLELSRFSSWSDIGRKKLEVEFCCVYQI